MLKLFFFFFGWYHKAAAAYHLLKWDFCVGHAVPRPWIAVEATQNVCNMKKKMLYGFDCLLELYLLINVVFSVSV